MQQAKFIDVTRTYLPIKASTFPVTMHGTAREDAPENRIPVMAYEGKNFLPTANGYTSYFGIVSQLEVDALNEKVDFIFNFQNEIFENILIALCDSGIWFKRGSTVGAWTQAHTVVAPSDPAVHYEWSWCVINNELYAYQQNKPNYQKIEGAVGPGITVTSYVPNTLNMAGQQGIFRAGGRLGFWDSDNSLSWSNQDSFVDFETSLTTLAGSSKFLDVYGRIVTIKGMGPGFIIYCTKSILYINPDYSNTFQWQPQVIFSNNGIVYPRNIVQASPDDVAYVYTRQGIFKIENAKEELILPEFFDTLQKHQGPIYLALLEGRYLCFEVLDPDFLEGLANFSEGTAEPITYYFPGYELDLDNAVADEVLSGNNFCKVLDGLNQGVYGAQPSFPDKKAGTIARPKYEAHLSSNGVKGDITNWINSPQPTIDPNGVEVNQCPDSGDLGKTSQLSTGDTGKVVVQGEDAYLDDSGWTMERFVAAQTAIWELEDNQREKFFNQVLARQKIVEDLTPDWGAVPFTESNILTKGLIGQYASEFSNPAFGFSTCEFWLTRICHTAKNIYRNKRNIVKNVDTIGAASSKGYVTNMTMPVVSPGLTASATTFADPMADLEAAKPVGGTIEYIVYAPGDTYSGGSSYAVADGAYLLRSNGLVRDSFSNPVYSRDYYEVYEAPAGKVVIVTVPVAEPVRLAQTQDAAGRYRKDETMVATNSAEDVALAPPIFDAGFCTLTGWEYTKDDDTQGVIFMPDCNAPAAFPEDSDIREALPNQGAGIGKDGNFCSHPFEPVIIPGADYSPVNWPPTSITLPASFFLLQDGSIAPKYPTFYGMFVYDLALKKWGKMDQQYKQLLNYSPINSALNGVIAYEDFGIKSGILSSGGKVHIFDRYPTSSYITYGKIGYYRRGMTGPEQVEVQFVEPSTGFLSIEPSLVGKFPNPSLGKTTPFTDADMVTLYGGNPGRWHNITISGHYNFNYIQFNGQSLKGNR